MSSERQGVRIWVDLPDKRLHPNGGNRHNVHALNRLFGERKELAEMLAREALWRGRIAEAPEYSVTITAHLSPRSASKSDRDNIGGWFKADRDGISKAIGVDDKYFRSPEVYIERERDEAHRGALIEVWAVQGEAT